eukprot:TRINITY_DN47385_c0_g1_i1.p1 TRINITY_DN47385_c0_g1~~TRINITY_DN47385_c0_g1_i1.p1  ORF type:complete len:239 (+),score=73.95 TRINITY_DN47385_c0_g1_i1:277-993(+)
MRAAQQGGGSWHSEREGELSDREMLPKIMDDGENDEEYSVEKQGEDAKSFEARWRALLCLPLSSEVQATGAEVMKSEGISKKGGPEKGDVTSERAKETVSKEKAKSKVRARCPNDVRKEAAGGCAEEEICKGHDKDEEEAMGDEPRSISIKAELAASVGVEVKPQVQYEFEGVAMSKSDGGAEVEAMSEGEYDFDGVSSNEQIEAAASDESLSRRLDAMLEKAGEVEEAFRRLGALHK